MPLGAAMRTTLTPAAVAFDRATVVGAASLAERRPVTLAPHATAIALLLDAALAVIFWSATRALRHGGQRWLVRAIASLGLVLVPLAVLHHLNLVAALDALWPAVRRDLRPWGPFVSRNDFAGWLLVATGLTLGYLVARLEAHHHDGEPLDPERAFDRTGTRLAASMCVMVGGVMASLSRSGALGIAIGVAVFFAIGAPRLSPARRRSLAFVVVALLAAGGIFANVGALSTRVGLSMSEGLTGRWSIWSQTMPVVCDFWTAGVGVGAYARAMTLYQTSTRLITIAHADNELLQLAAEGGVLVGVPALAVLIAFVSLVRRRIRADRTRMFWVRAGAASGLAAIAAQNLVEMTLRVPATALLVVVAAAVAVHERVPPAAPHDGR